MSRLIYVHVPKCGGSSFGAALRLRHFPRAGRIDIRRAVAEARAADPALTGEALIRADYARRAAQLRDHVRRGLPCIAGHVRYDPDLHDGAARDYAFVTLLRDPVARFVSHYRYLQRRHPAPDRPGRIEAFLDTADARRLARQYLFYFAGDWAAEDDAAAIATASANLARFDLVGDLSDTAGFVARLRALTGKTIPPLMRNRAPGPARVSPDTRRRIEALCAADIAIYRSVPAMRSRAA